MRTIISSFIIVAIFVNCANQRITEYNVPMYIVEKSHQEIMSDFKTKNQVFLEFGTPDQQMQVDSIINFSYRLGEETKTIGLSNSNATYSGVAVRNNNPFYSGNYLTSANYNNFAVITSKSVETSNTVIKYVKFWMINDQVIKWETQGIDKSTFKRNPKYNSDIARKIEKKNKNNVLVSVVGFTCIAGMLAVLLSLIGSSI